MKLKTYTRGYEEQDEKANLWDAFVNHLDTVYFSGASEVLSNQIITFEYESFKHSYAR